MPFAFEMRRAFSFALLAGGWCVLSSVEPVVDEEVDNKERSCDHKEHGWVALFGDQHSDGDGEEEGAVSGDCRCPADDPACLSRGEDHRHLLESAGVADSTKEEDSQHTAEESRPGSHGVRVGKRGCCEGAPDETEGGESGDFATTEFVADRSGKSANCGTD